MKSKHVYHHITLNTTIKAKYSERVILTLKRILYRFVTKQRSYRYVVQLQNIVDSYNEGIATYTIKDFLNELISGNFYSSEIQKVFKDGKSLWYIEKKIRSRTYRGRKQFFVKFDGWDSRFNCWIDADDIQEHKLLK